MFLCSNQLKNNEHLQTTKYYIYHGSYKLTYLNQRIRISSRVRSMVYMVCNRNYMIDRSMTSKAWNNRSMTSKSWNNIKIFMLDHGSSQLFVLRAVCRRNNELFLVPWNKTLKYLNYFLLGFYSKV
jgi:hypothetical protein